MLEESHCIIKAAGSDLFGVDGIGTAFAGTQAVLQQVIDTLPQNVFWKDKNLVYRGCNQTFAEVAGRSKPDELVGLTDFDLPWNTEEAEFFRQCDRKVMESGVPLLGIIETQVNADGKQTWLETNKVPLRNAEGQVLGVLGTFIDITEIKQVKDDLEKINQELELRVQQRTKQLQFAADHDGLTGLLNRSSFVKKLNDINDACEPKSIALLFIDLDNFKPINDTEGHEAGDKVLVQLANVLRKTSGPDDFAARLGGDEFLLLLQNRSEDQLHSILEQIHRSVIYQAEVCNFPCRLTASIGVVNCSPGDYECSEDLIKDADVAMYAAKSQGKNSFCFYSDNLRQSSENGLKLESALFAGISQDQFLVHFQPIVDSSADRIVGFEALARWQHPEKGLLFPSCFVSPAEANGAIVPLGKKIFDLACAQTAQWFERFPQLTENFRTNINVSARQLFEEDFLQTICDITAKHGVDNRNIGIEITESVMLKDQVQAISILQEMRDAGFHIALDDFGTGFSSLSYIDDLPLNAVKIDRSFISKLGCDAADYAIVQMILALAKTLNISAIAEGVENPFQLERLNEMGCHLLQGYHYSCPLPAEEATSYLISHERCSFNR